MLWKPDKEHQYILLTPTRAISTVNYQYTVVWMKRSRINIVPAKPLGILGSVATLPAATIYQGHHGWNKLWYIMKRNKLLRVIVFIFCPSTFGHCVVCSSSMYGQFMAKCTRYSIM
jgi:hypothetical protein